MKPLGNTGHFISDHVDPNHPNWATPLQRRLVLLADFDYRAALGAGTTLDQVKFTRWQPSHCECDITYIWHRDSTADERVHVPHEQHALCDHHEAQGHRGKLKEHHQALADESAVIGAAADALSKEHGVHISHIYRQIVNGELVVGYPALTDPETGELTRPAHSQKVTASRRAH